MIDKWAGALFLLSIVSLVAVSYIVDCVLVEVEALGSALTSAILNWIALLSMGSELTIDSRLSSRFKAHEYDSSFSSFSEIDFRSGSRVQHPWQVFAGLSRFSGLGFGARAVLLVLPKLNSILAFLSWTRRFRLWIDRRTLRGWWKQFVISHISILTAAAFIVGVILGGWIECFLWVH